LGCIAFCGGTAALGAAVFAWFTPQGDWRLLVIFLAAMLAPLIALCGWLRSPRGQLAWDGQRWRWSDATGTREYRMGQCLDWQRFVLVRLDDDRVRPLWLWLQPGSRTDTTWLPLRRAIVSSLVMGREAGRPRQPRAEELTA
jgi:hypothetical protein